MLAQNSTIQLCTENFMNIKMCVFVSGPTFTFAVFTWKLSSLTLIVSGGGVGVGGDRQ